MTTFSESDVQLRLSHSSRNSPNNSPTDDKGSLGRREEQLTTRKEVRFSSRISILVYRKVKESEEPKVWYSSAEANAIKRECAFTIKCCMSLAKMGASLEYDGMGLCMRGLEKLIPKAQEHKKNTRAESKEAVFEEQWRQWNDCHDDEDLIAEKYRATTLVSEKFAILRGEQDATVAARGY